MTPSDADLLVLPTWEQTAHTEAVILLKKFESMVFGLTGDELGQDLRNLLDVLPMIGETHTSRHILAGAVKAMRANRKESSEDFNPSPASVTNCRGCVRSRRSHGEHAYEKHLHSRVISWRTL